MKATTLPTIIDVRSPQEFQSQHYPGAINIPLHEIKNHLQEIREMSTPIIAYCMSGARSMMAVSILKENGIENVENGGGLFNMFEDRKSFA
jgi:phage shock protein E